MPDKGLEKALADLGLYTDKPFMLPKEEARDMGATCRDCGSRKVVYTITTPLAGMFPAGSYCYEHLVKRCKAARLVPYPIELELLDRIKASLGLPPWAVTVPIRNLGGKSK